LGFGAGAFQTTGDRNTYVGASAAGLHSGGSENTFIGYGAGGILGSESGNVFIGHLAGYFESGSNKLHIANDAELEDVLIYGDFSTHQIGMGTTNPSDETALHVRTVNNNFGVMVDAAGVSGSEIGLHAATSLYCSLAKNAYYEGDWKRFNTSNGAYMEQVAPDGEVGFFVDEAGANPISWVEAMTIAAAGNVGIGTSSPARKLHVCDVMRLQPRNTAPSSPVKGDIYMNNLSNKLMVYDGTTWQACW